MPRADVAPRRPQRQHSRFGALHRVFGVDHEVQQHLLQLLVVAEKLGQFGIQLRPHLDTRRLQ